jgi:type 1 glutamine amidotransferase
MILSISNRGYFRLKTTIFLLGFLILIPIIAQGQSRKEQASSLKNKKVVYVWGGWKNHHPEKTVDLFVPWLRSEGLQNAILNGTGMAGWHGGTGDSFRGDLKYQYMIGGQFVSHPGGKSEYKVKIVDRKDSITKGVKDFYVKNTEQYYMLMDPNVKALATSKYTKASYLKKGFKKIENLVTGSIVPVVWKKNFGKRKDFL